MKTADSTDPREYLKARDVAVVMRLATLLRLCASRPGAFKLVVPALEEFADQLSEKYIPGLAKLEHALQGNENGVSRLVDRSAESRPQALHADDVYYRLETLLRIAQAGRSPGVRLDSREKIRIVCGILEPTIRSAMAERLILLQRRPSTTELRSAVTILQDLSPREVQVAREIVAGKTNKEIASGFGIGAETVKTYITRIYAKLMVRNRPELVQMVRTTLDRRRRRGEEEE